MIKHTISVMKLHVTMRVSTGRFYQLFESIYRYYSDFAAYLEELTDGV